MSHSFRPLEPRLTLAWQERSPVVRLNALRAAAPHAREALLGSGTPLALATCKLVTFPYPTQFAFSGAALSPAPFAMMTNRMQLVQFLESGERKTLLFNPTDYARSRQATFYVDLARRFGPMLSERVIPTYFGTVASHLTDHGLSPGDVDYIAFDHLHVQDLRGWLGGDGPAYFPRAKLLVMRDEWQSVQSLHPMNAVWYVPNGCAVPDDRVVQLHESMVLGSGVAVLSTPGHTLGNMSLAVATPHGPFVVSENGVSADSFAPAASSIPGLASYAKRMRWDVVLNGNTREASLDQYSSMELEKLIAGPSREAPEFWALCPSSDLTESWLSPGLSPTYAHAPADFGLFRRNPS